MPNHILTMDIMEEMLDNISVIKLNTYIEMSKKQIYAISFYYCLILLSLFYIIIYGGCIAVMKKFIYILFLFFYYFIIVGCGKENDEIKFKNEYESLNFSKNGEVI